MARASNPAPRSIGTVRDSFIQPAVAKEEIVFTQKDIEDYLQKDLQRGGWKVSFKWEAGQCPSLIARREKEVIAED
jgi:hypothetical protein